MRISTIEWPEELLGCPLKAGYQATIKNRNLRSSIENGVANYGRYFFEDHRIFSLTFAWTQAQLLVWETFFENVLHGGMRWFQMRNVAIDGTMQSLYCHIHKETSLSGRIDSAELYTVTFEVEAHIYAP